MSKDMAIYMRERRKLFRKRAADLLGGECSGCGSIENLEFDHIDPTSKQTTIANALANGWSWISLEAELAKCQLLCHDCHVEKSSDEGSFARGNKPKIGRDHGMAVTYNEGCRCETCRSWKSDYRNGRVDARGRLVSS